MIPDTIFCALKTQVIPQGFNWGFTDAKINSAIAANDVVPKALVIQPTVSAKPKIVK